MRKLLVLTCIFSLLGCEQLNNPTVQSSLRVFCALHRADIISVMNTPQLQQAATLVCGAAGFGLGNP